MLVLATGLLSRVALVMYVLSHYGPAWFFSRGSEMGFLAYSLLHGQGLSSPFGISTGPTAIVAPGYPLLVAATFRILGCFTLSAALCLMLFHAGCNTVTVYLIYRLGERFADPGAAAIAALFWACSLPLVWMPTIFWETSVSCMLVIGLLAAMLGVRQKRSIGFWAACGALCGVAALFNPALLPSILILTAYTLLKTTPRKGGGLRLAGYLVGLILTFSPWPVRNVRAFHACVLTRSTVGLELWMGNHPGATGFLDQSLFPTYNAAELADYRNRGEIAYMASKSHLASHFIQAHPVYFALLSGRRLLRFWTGTGTRGGSVLFNVHAVVSSCSAFCGLFLLWRRGQRRHCVSATIILLLFPLPYYITHAEFRYRLVVDPMLTALGAPAIQWILECLRSTCGTRRLQAGPPSQRDLRTVRSS